MLSPIEKANRMTSKLRLLLVGPSGSGKTYGAISLGLSMGEKLGVIDTERKTARLYSHLGDFLVIEFTPPYLSEHFVEAIHQLEKEKCDVIIIDSLTHEWSGEGGILEQHRIIANRVHNDFLAWSQVTPSHNKVLNAILSSNAHLIVTVRAKTIYEMITNEKGKKEPQKLGLGPQQKEGLEYEFTTVFDLGYDHMATSNKDRTGIFDNRVFMLNKDIADELIKWCNTGESPKERMRKSIMAFKVRAETANHIEVLQKEFAVYYKMFDDEEYQTDIKEIYDELKQKFIH